MIYEIDGKEYKVEIIRKNNKNTYIRIKDNYTISVTTNYFVTKRKIYDLINLNVSSIKKMIDRKKIKLVDDQKFCYLGRYYDIIIVPSEKDIYINDSKIIVKDEKYLNKWLNQNINNLFNERLKYNYDLMNEKFEYPNLKIRKMKSRWGVCNKKNMTITLNSNLIRYSIDKLDYVIIHELSHFIHFNHSKEFWTLVEKYCPNYKEIKKMLKD